MSTISFTEATNFATDLSIKSGAGCARNRKWEAAVSRYLKFIWWSIAATEIASRFDIISFEENLTSV